MELSGETVLTRGRFLELVKEEKTGWEFVRRVKGSTPVGIVAVTGKGHLILISQYRVPVGAEVIEIPAGLVGDQEDGEGWELAAKRELLEETGYACDRVEELSLGPTSAGMATELIRLVRAHGLTKVGEAHGDGDEEITVHEVPVEQVGDWLRERVKQGVLVDPKVYAALWFVA